MHHLFWVRFNSSFQCYSLIGWCFRMNLSSCAYQIFFWNISITVYREIFPTVLFSAFLFSLSAGKCLKFTKKTPTVFKCRRAKFKRDEHNPAYSIPYWVRIPCLAEKLCVPLCFVMPCYKQLYYNFISEWARLHIIVLE